MSSKQKQNTLSQVDPVKFSDIDIKNIENIFSLARRSVIEDEVSLVRLISYKKELIDKIKEYMAKDGTNTKFDENGAVADKKSDKG